VTKIADTSRLIFCNGCGAVSINTPAFGWARYHVRECLGDIVVCHHCPSCREYFRGGRVGLVHDTPAKDAIVYEQWVAT